MHAAILAALTQVIGWLASAGTLRWIFSAVLLALGTILIDALLTLLPAGISAAGITSGLGVLPPQAWYFIDMFRVQQGTSLVLSAYVARFVIRRLPIIG